MVADFTLGEGENATFVLRRLDSRGRATGRCPGVGEAEELFRDTVAYWRRWLSRCTYTGRWREMVERSALTLKLLSFEPTGAIVAAPTCSLPESIGGPRNWDYRYTWIRDAAFTLYGLLRIGFTEEAARFRDWLKDRWQDADGRGTGPLQLMYGIDGRADLTEETLDHLEGYRGSRPVRIGNGAHRQLQLDIYGELMDAVYLHNKYVEPIGYDGWVRLRQLVDWVCDNWTREDEGIWEVRGGRRHVRLLEVHVLGRARPRPAAGRQALLPGRPAALAEGPRRDLRGGHGPRLEPEPPGVRRSPSAPTPWTRRAC